MPRVRARGTAAARRIDGTRDQGKIRPAVRFEPVRDSLARATDVLVR